MAKKVVHKAKRPIKNMQDKVEKLKKEQEKEHEKPKSEGIFTPVEREIILADMKYLIEKEKESGDWAKWEESQRPFRQFQDLERRRTIFMILGESPTQPNRPNILPNEITYQYFLVCTGRAPEKDDLARCNCTTAGLMGHTSCGWCGECNKPRFMCPDRVNHTLLRRISE
jgi:hypothetical protein